MERYEIRVTGHLDDRRAEALGAESLRLLPGPQSLLSFAVPDQSGLYGVLARLRDAGIGLVAAVRVEPGDNSRGAS